MVLDVRLNWLYDVKKVQRHPIVQTQLASHRALGLGEMINTFEVTKPKYNWQSKHAYYIQLVIHDVTEMLFGKIFSLNC